MPFLKMQFKRIKRGDLVIRATLEPPRSPENLPKGAHVRQYWTYARMVSIILPLRPLFDILDVHPLEIVDAPEIACRLPVGGNNLENMIYGKQYLLWVLGRGFEQDQVMQITSILDPESDWDYQMLVKDLRLDFRNDGRRLNKARVTRLLTYEDDELASLLIDVEASRFALSQRSRTGCRKLDDELSTLLSVLRDIRKALVIWMWEADTGLDDIRDSIQRCEVARDLWQDAVEAEKARQKAEAAKKTREAHRRFGAASWDQWL